MAFLLLVPLLAFSAPRQIIAAPALEEQTTNDFLWLEITSPTSLLIHHPSTNLAGVYGVYFSTNPFAADSWTWLFRSAPEQTDLVVSNLPPDLGFFRLGPPTAIRPGFDLQEVEPNDDGCTGLVPIGFPINYFGTNRTDLYINNNGSVTFDSPLGSYTPKPLESLGMDIIAPFWADVDTRPPGSLPLTYGPGTVEGRLAFGVNWIDVGYYSWEDNKLNTFQLVVVDRSDRAEGDYDIEFNYAKIQWETGDASEGIKGLGGAPARIGFASIDPITSEMTMYEMQGSGISGSFLDDTLSTGLIYSHFNSTVPGRYVLQFHDGAPLATP